jgi:tetratricopeptide (TPR) repeat protein
MDKFMKKFSPVFLCTLFLLHSLSTISLATGNSTTDGQWLQKNLIKPTTQPTFTITVKRQMLDPMAKEEFTSMVDYSGMTDDALQKEIETAPLVAEPYILMNQRYQKDEKFDQGGEILSAGLKNLFRALDKDGGNWQLGREVQEIYRSVHQQEKVKKMAVVFLKNNPDNVDTLFDLAMIEILSANFPAARTHIDKAYELSSRNAEIYLAEFLYQLKHGETEIAKTGLSDSITWPVSMDFFTQAAKESPELTTPQTTLHGLQVIQAFYSAILRNINRLSSKEPFDFVLDTRLATRLDEGKQYFMKSFGNKQIDPYFAQICLLMAAVVENDQVTADKLYTKLIAYPEVDNEMYRLMLIGDLAKAQIPRAIRHLNDSISKKDNIQDRLMLAYLHEGEGNAAKSLETLEEYKGQLSLKLLINRLGYAILTNNPTTIEQLYAKYKGVRQLWRDPDFLYYALVAEALQGKAEEVKKIEKLLPPDSDWSRSAKKISLYLLKDRMKKP